MVVVTQMEEGELFLLVSSQAINLITTREAGICLTALREGLLLWQQKHTATIDNILPNSIAEYYSCCYNGREGSDRATIF